LTCSYPLLGSRSLAAPPRRGHRWWSGVLCFRSYVSPSPALARLEGHLRELGSVLVCFSGGIDSALVLAVATRALGDRAVALTAVSPSLPARELDAAKRVATDLGARHVIEASHELERPGYAANGPDRCFHCKSELYSIAEQKRRDLGLAHVVNGTNQDDLGDYRPGLKAASDARVQSPLVTLGFGKSAVRALSQELGLAIWDKPAAACLSSRIPYGTRVTPEKLARIERLERALQDQGFRQVRVRDHGEVARIEVDAAELPRLVQPEVAALVSAAGRAAGFAYVTLDLLGYRTGSHNEVLPRRALPVIA
jgi:uncharacterized protein